MSSQFSFVFGADVPSSSSSSSSSNPNPPASSSGVGRTSNIGQFTFGSTSISVQRHLEEQMKELQEKLKIAQSAIEAQRKQIADADKGRAMAEVRVVDLEVELDAEKKAASEKILKLETQLTSGKEDALILEVERLGNELREKEEQLLHQMEEKWIQFDQIQEVNKALDLVKGTWASQVQKVEDEREVAQATLEYNLSSIQNINAGVWAMAKELLEEKKLTEALKQKAMDLDEEVKKSKATKNMLRSFNIQQKSAHGNTKAKLFQKILQLEAENQSLKKESSVLNPWPPTPQLTFSFIGQIWPFIVMTVTILAFAGFWVMFGWQEQLGAFGYGGPNVDNWFTRFLALICVLSEDLLLD